MEGTILLTTCNISCIYYYEGQVFSKNLGVFLGVCIMFFLYCFFCFFFLKSSFFFKNLISHDNWWVSWENQIKTKEILQGPWLNNKALSRGCYRKPLSRARYGSMHRPFIIPLKPQCNKNWVRLRVFLLPMQWGSTRRKKHKSFFINLKIIKK